MVIHNDDVGFQGSLSDPRHKTTIEVRALLTRAGFPARIQVAPQQQLVRKLLQLRAISGFGLSRPIPDLGQILGIMPRKEVSLSIDLGQLFQTEVVTAAFHVTDRQLATQRLLQKRDVLEKKLFLQVFGAGGDDYPLAAENAGKQIGQSLTCPCARLDAKMMALFDGVQDSLRHSNLRRTKLIIGMIPGDDSIRPQELFQLGPGNHSSHEDS